MINTSTKPNKNNQDAEYERKRSFINANIQVGDYRDLEKITGLTSNYIYMVCTDRRRSPSIIDTAYKYISDRMNLVAVHRNNMSLTNP